MINQDQKHEPGLTIGYRILLLTIAGSIHPQASSVRPSDVPITGLKHADGWSLIPCVSCHLHVGHVGLSLLSPKLSYPDREDAPNLGMHFEMIFRRIPTNALGLCSDLVAKVFEKLPEGFTSTVRVQGRTK